AGKFSNEYHPAKVTALDDIAKSEVDIMKIDVEGHEVQVLKGARRLIEKWHPLIFLEAHWQELPMSGESAKSLEAILKDYGYTMEWYNGEPVKEFGVGHWNRMICR